MLTDDFLTELLQMMYDFHRGDMLTLDKYPHASNEQLGKAISSRSQSFDSRKNESFNNASMRDSRKVTPPRSRLLNPSPKVAEIRGLKEAKPGHELEKPTYPARTAEDDLNPNLSIEDTPVAASKVLKPGSKKKLMIDEAKKLLEQNPADPEWQQNYMSFSETLGNNSSTNKFRNQQQPSEEERPQFPAKTSDDLFRRFMEVGGDTNEQRIRIEDEADRNRNTNFFGIESLSSAGRKITHLGTSPHPGMPFEEQASSLESRKQSLPRIDTQPKPDMVQKLTPRSASVGRVRGRDAIRQDSIKRIKKITDLADQRMYTGPKQVIRSSSQVHVQQQELAARKDALATPSDSTRVYRSRPIPTPTPKETEGKFAYLREKYKRDSSRHSGRDSQPTHNGVSPVVGVVRSVPKRADSAVGRDRSREAASKDRSRYFRDDDFRRKFHVDLAITPVTAEQVQRVLEWTQDLGYLKYMRADSELSDECRDGSFFFKLLNHLERAAVLQGANTASHTGVRANFERVFAHLKKYEKFNPRYLCSEYYLINGNKDVFWGLLDDVRLVYANRVSGKDTRYRRKDKDGNRGAGQQSREGLRGSLSPVSYNLSE